MSENAKTILIVDSDLDFLALERTHLEQAGYNVVSAETSTAAQDAIAANKVDLVVLEVMLEHMDSGFGLCYQIKKSNPNMPIIIVTAVAAKTGVEFDAVTAEEKSWIKADVLLAKPARFEELKREIERLLAAATIQA